MMKVKHPARDTTQGVWHGRRTGHSRDLRTSPHPLGTVLTMRILHTSDWHLGRLFGGLSLLDQQHEFVDWLVELVTRERVELVIVAGDVHDRAVPAGDAVMLWRDALQRLRIAGARVVAIAGNHDGPERLAAYDGLTDLAGVYVRGGYGRAGHVLTLDGADGPLDIVAVPYLDPVLAPRPSDANGRADFNANGSANGDEDSDEAAPRRPTHESVLKSALATGRAACHSPRSLAIAHAFVVGGAVSDSERHLTVGGTGQVAAEVLDRFSYVALGHLHRPQVIGGQPHVRYSGSPLPYSFSEDHVKQVALVDLAPDGAVSVTPVDVPVGRAVATVEGPIADVLDNPRYEAITDRYVRAILTDPGYVLDAKARLRERFPYIVNIELRPARPGGSDLGSTDGVERRGERHTPLDTVSDFWRDVTTAEPSDEVLALLRDALQAGETEAVAR